jgi:hypothetical protein
VHAGKTAVPLPGIARLWPGNTLKDLDVGYLTDQRDFDNAFGASSRMTSMCEIEVLTSAIIKQTHTTSGTTEVNLVTGVQSGFGSADMRRCAFTSVINPPKAPPSNAPLFAHFAAGRRESTLPSRILPVKGPSSQFGPIEVWLRAAAGDPLVGMAADIDYSGTLKVSEGKPGSLEVSFEGKLDAFPAYDCYVAYDGITKTVFTSSPPPGKTVADLLGPANRPIWGAVSFP